MQTESTIPEVYTDMLPTQPATPYNQYSKAAVIAQSIALLLGDNDPRAQTIVFDMHLRALIYRVRESHAEEDVKALKARWHNARKIPARVRRSRTLYTQWEVDHMHIMVTPDDARDAGIVVHAKPERMLFALVRKSHEAQDTKSLRKGALDKLKIMERTTRPSRRNRKGAK